MSEEKKHPMFFQWSWGDDEIALRDYPFPDNITLFCADGEPLPPIHFTTSNPALEDVIEFITEEELTQIERLVDRLATRPMAPIETRPIEPSNPFIALNSINQHPLRPHQEEIYFATVSAIDSPFFAAIIKIPAVYYEQYSRSIFNTSGALVYNPISADDVARAFLKCYDQLDGDQFSEIAQYLSMHHSLSSDSIEILIKSTTSSIPGLIQVYPGEEIPKFIFRSYSHFEAFMNNLQEDNNG